MGTKDSNAVREQLLRDGLAESVCRWLTWTMPLEDDARFDGCSADPTIEDGSIVDRGRSDGGGTDRRGHGRTR